MERYVWIKTRLCDSDLDIFHLPIGNILSHLNSYDILNTQTQEDLSLEKC